MTEMLSQHLNWYCVKKEKQINTTKSLFLGDFFLFRKHGNDNVLSRHDGFTIGEAWILEDGRYYTSLWATGGHANSKDSLGSFAAAEQWAVRRWKSDNTCTVTISGHVGKLMPWGANWRGECQAIIVVDGKIVLSTVVDNHGLDYENDSDEAMLWVWAMGNWNKVFGCEVPYRCMIPKYVDGLLLACRAISMTYVAHMEFRMLS